MAEQKIGKKVIEWLGRAVKDLSSLQVETYRADISATVSNAGNQPIPLDTFIENLEVKVDPSADTLKLVMVTIGKVDYDTAVLYSSQLDESDERFITHHMEAYEAAAAARAEIAGMAFRLAQGAVVPND